MKLRFVGILGLAMLLAPVVGAQTKVSGSHKCDKAEVVGTTDVGDKAGHSMSILKHSCKWTTQMEMEGQKTTDGTSVFFSEMTATKANDSGTYIGNMDNGDKFFVSFHDTAAVKDGKPGEAKGTWFYTGGTGKLKGITGKGTYTVKTNEDGTAEADVEGEYSIAAAAPKKAAAKKAE